MFIINKYILNGDWGLGIGDWGFGDWAQSPIPNPQSPIPINNLKYKYKYYLKLYNNNKIINNSNKL